MLPEPPQSPHLLVGVYLLYSTETFSSLYNPPLSSSTQRNASNRVSNPIRTYTFPFFYGNAAFTLNL